ncbi:MAG TPA: hypothetical protein VLM79_28890, partial [Kofleriaceae bacterium]|nr:hypothetical protein [Kofleriaceae bacterium]
MTDVLRARLITVVVTAACWFAHAASASPGTASPRTASPGTASLANAAASSAELVDALASDDVGQVERAVGAIAAVR